MSKEKNKNNCADYNDCAESCTEKRIDTVEGGFKFLVCEKNDEVPIEEIKTGKNKNKQ